MDDHVLIPRFVIGPADRGVTAYDAAVLTRRLEQWADETGLAFLGAMVVGERRDQNAD